MTTGAAGAQAPEPADYGTSPGGMLRRQREQRGLSLQDVADELHLDRRVVETIEADHFLALGAPVYARGHLRKYAQLLELAPETVLASYESLSEGSRLAAPANPVPVIPPTTSDQRSSVWIALGALAVCVAALAIWKIAEPPESEPAAARPVRPPEPAPGALPAEQVAAAESSPAPAAVASEVPPQAPQVAQEAPLPEQPAVAPLVQTPPTPVEAERVELVLDFTEASWVEVYDAAGGKLMFDIGQPGSPRKLSGSAPLTVLLGKADAVQVTADGQPIVVPRRAGRDAARFTVAAGGAVR